MTKYKVSQAVMDKLYKVASRKHENYIYLLKDVKEGIGALAFWVYGDDYDVSVSRIREQAVIDYVFNGADNFEVKTPTWVIVSKKKYGGIGWYSLCLNIPSSYDVNTWESSRYGNREDAIDNATRITDLKLKDALLYANKDFEAIEVEE